MNKEKLIEFLAKARTKTYAGASGKVKPIFKDSKQLEYQEKEWLYRDIYYVGNGIFAGLETVYQQDKPVFSMSYFGNFKGMAEDEIDQVLRQALSENSQKTRLFYHVSWKLDHYQYKCTPDMTSGIEEIGGSESITKDGQQIYYLYYAGGCLVK
jgi:hypothetical protein